MATDLPVAELDFDVIKENLKTKLKETDTFKDYNFEGSNLSTLLDVMANTTHYMGFYANMLASEMFLDSAIQRSSVMSVAYQMGYIPKSTIASKVYIDIQSTVAGTLQRGSQFIDSTNSKIWTVIDEVAFGVSETKAVKLHQGTLKSKTTTYTLGDVLLIQEKLIDTTTINVIVNPGQGNATTWTVVENLVDVAGSLTNNSTVYEVLENIDGFYEVKFFEQYTRPTTNSPIEVQFLSTDGELSNNTSVTSKVNGVCTANFSPIVAGNWAVVSVNRDIEGVDIGNDCANSVIQYSTGGKAIESIPSIKLNTSRRTHSQNRAITAIDYKNILLEKYGNEVSSVAVWDVQLSDVGATSADLGIVYLSMKASNGLYLLPSVKNDIVADLYNKYSVSNVKIVYNSPIYLNINLSINININTSILSTPITVFVSQVDATIRDYFDDSVTEFGNKFRYSSLVSTIDSITEVLSNTTSFDIGINTTHISNVVEYLYFKNPIIAGTINSLAHQSSIPELLIYDKYSDSNLGTLYYTFSGTNSVNTEVALPFPTNGIDYVTGVVTLTIADIVDSLSNEIIVSGFDIKLFGTPISLDVVSDKQYLINVDNIDITTTID